MSCDAVQWGSEGVARKGVYCAGLSADNVRRDGLWLSAHRGG